MILFSITRLEFSVLYVVRWTCWTKKLDVKITYNFLSICYFCLCLSCCCLNHWSFFSWVLPSFLNFFSPLLTRHNTTFSPFSCRLSMPRCVSTPRLERCVFACEHRTNWGRVVFIKKSTKRTRGNRNRRRDFCCEGSEIWWGIRQKKRRIRNLVSIRQKKPRSQRTP